MARVRESLYTQANIRINTILNNIDTRTILPRCKGSCMVYIPKWYRKPKYHQIPITYWYQNMWNPHYRYPNGIKKRRYQSNTDICNNIYVDHMHIQGLLLVYKSLYKKFGKKKEITSLSGQLNSFIPQTPPWCPIKHHLWYSMLRRISVVMITIGASRFTAASPVNSPTFSSPNSSLQKRLSCKWRRI